MLVIPLRVQGQVIGSLSTGRDRAGPLYQEEDQTLLQVLADRAALTIQNARLFRSVNKQRERLGMLSARLAEAQEAERRAVARELHDEIGQVLIAVSANLQSMRISNETSFPADRLDESVTLVDDALRQIRDLALDLRPSMLDDFGLVPALTWYADRQAQRSGMRVTFFTDLAELRIAPDLETTVFRVAQIALTNVIRHARAQQARVDLQRYPDGIELIIGDDGQGFDLSKALEQAGRGATLGLLSMQERVRLANGALEIKATPGLGTHICARFPIGGEEGP